MQAGEKVYRLVRRCAGWSADMQAGVQVCRLMSRLPDVLVC